MADESSNAPLDTAQCAALLALARHAIAAPLSLDALPAPDVSAAAFDMPLGAFVTLHTARRLRGCIGHIESDRPLRETIADMALAAAMRDPRFPALTTDELSKVRIEISVLSALHPVRDVSDIVPGVHGLVVETDDTRGLLLPQVAVQYGWDAETFLQNTCDKASLPSDSWQQEGTRVFYFTAQIFEEPEN